MHNLYISFAEIKKIKNAISQGNLWELVERKANSNPYLLESMKVLWSKEVKEFLEKIESISKDSAIFYTGSNTIHRPILYRTYNRLKNRYKLSEKIVVLPEGEKPYSKKWLRGE